MHLTAALSASVLNSALGQNLGRRRVELNLHTQLDLRGNLPVFVLLTKASVHDVNAMDEICVEMGGYLSDGQRICGLRQTLQHHPQKWRILCDES